MKLDAEHRIKMHSTGMRCQSYKNLIVQKKGLFCDKLDCLVIKIPRYVTNALGYYCKSAKNNVSFIGLGSDRSKNCQNAENACSDNFFRLLLQSCKELYS